MSRLKIALLGAPEIIVDGALVKSDRRKAVALLAYMAVTGKTHSRDHLAALLWPDYDQSSAYAYLRRTVWELNKVLGKGWIEAGRDTIAMLPSPDLWLDTTAFQEGTQDASDPVAGLEDAISLYRGDFLEGFAVADTATFEEWQFEQAEYFRRLFSGALEELVRALNLGGDFETALLYARRWLALDTLNEPAHCAVIRTLAGMGDRTGAIRQYETCIQILNDELGIEPLPETSELYGSILRGEISAGQRTETAQVPDHPPPPDAGENVMHLPSPPTPFIGRRPEVEQVKKLVLSPDHRLVTLTGPGGTGKTRLSIQAASELGDAFRDGIYFARLSPVQSADRVIPALAKALDFTFFLEEERPRQQLLDYLCDKQLLIVMDNFEHLLEASVLVKDILTKAAGVKVIATSRVRLNIQGEQLFQVGGMRTPDASEINDWDDPEEQARPFSAVQLFLDRARRVQPDFTLTSQNTGPVMEICRLVRGMPLGLELASTWLELLTPQEIAAEIRNSLDFLETDQAGVPDRQRSIRAVFESSWKLLDEQEREVFRRLCVFVGSFSRQAAQKVSGASLRTLLKLADKSWLQHTGGGRFLLHELMQ